MIATQNKTFKLSHGNKTGTFYAAVHYTVQGETVKVQKYIWDSWGVIPSGWKKPEIMTVEAARKHYRENIESRYYQKESN